MKKTFAGAFTVAPIEAMQAIKDGTINHFDFVLLSFLGNHVSAEHGFAWPSNKYLMNYFAVTDRAIQKALSNLIQANLIFVSIDRVKRGTFRKIFVNHVRFLTADRSISVPYATHTPEDFYLEGVRKDENTAEGTIIITPTINPLKTKISAEKNGGGGELQFGGGANYSSGQSIKKYKDKETHTARERAVKSVSLRKSKTLKAKTLSLTANKKESASGKSKPEQETAFLNSNQKEVSTALAQEIFDLYPKQQANFLSLTAIKKEIEELGAAGIADPVSFLKEKTAAFSAYCSRTVKNERYIPLASNWFADKRYNDLYENKNKTEWEGAPDETQIFR